MSKIMAESRIQTEPSMANENQQAPVIENEATMAYSNDTRGPAQAAVPAPYAPARLGTVQEDDASIMAVC